MDANPKEFYRFLGLNAFRGLLWLAGILGAYYLLKILLGEELNLFLQMLGNNRLWVMLVFFVSETILGIIPAELFIIWATQFPLNEFVMLLIAMFILSYLGGLIAFGMGTQVKQWAWIKKILSHERLQKYTQLYQQYGGIVIVVSALTPLPYAAISLVSASLGFSLKAYLLYASSRLLRFVFLGYLLWEAGL